MMNGYQVRQIVRTLPGIITLRGYQISLGM
jgi:hypothetical protein